MIYKCIKCNKIFKYESDLNRHKDRKTSCDIKKELKCISCNVSFTCPYNQKIHEKTQKHINNYNEINNISNNNLNKNELENVELRENNLNLKNEIKSLKLENLELKEKNLNLKNEIESLKLENLELKSTNKLHNKLEYIYIIHPIQCINLNIYKIGRTNNIINRHKQYPKGSELLFTIPCDNSKILEQEILTYCKNNINYEQIKKYGNEYFKCDINLLISDIQNLILKQS